MKPKILILSLITFLIFSCKSDDENGQSSVNPKLIKTINWGISPIDFYFNDDKSIQKMDINNGDEIHFNYAQNRISSMERGDLVCEFEYDADGKIKSFTKDGDVVNVSYNAASRTYSYESDEKEHQITLAENDDVEEFLIYYTQTEQIVLFKHTYDNLHHGPMTNSNAIMTHLGMAFDMYSAGFVSKKPLLNFYNNGPTSTFENTYDEDGFVNHSIVDDIEINYTYYE